MNELTKEQKNRLQILSQIMKQFEETQKQLVQIQADIRMIREELEWLQGDTFLLELYLGEKYREWKRVQ